MSSISPLQSSLEPPQTPDPAASPPSRTRSSHAPSNVSATIGATILDALNSANSGTGLGGGVNVSSLVDESLTAESAPLKRLEEQKTTLGGRLSALSNISTGLANLLTGVNSLADVRGAFSAVAVSSSDPGALTATAGAGAAPGVHTVVVHNLAATSSYYTDKYASSSAALPTGRFVLETGSGHAVTVTIDASNNTLSGLASSINGMDVGVTASVMSDADGARLALTSDVPGAAGDLTLADDTTGIGFTKAVRGENAFLTVDGIPIRSSSNTVSGVMSGVTLSLGNASPNKTVTVSVSADPGKATSAINSFVSAYNALVAAVNSQFAYDRSTGTAGALAGDSSLEIVQQTLLKDAAYSLTGNGGYTGLASLGIAMGDDGTLTVDGAVLNNALNSDFGAVQNLFQSASPAGFAVNFKNDLGRLTSPSSGPMNVESQNLSRELDDVGGQISDFQAKLDRRAKALTDQYSSINSTLQELPILLKEVNGEIDSLRPA